MLHFITGLVLLPFCWIAARTAWTLVLLPDPGDEILPLPAICLLAGFAVWQIFFIVLPRPVRIYILAHELTHALWGALMGARIRKMHIARDSGSVTLSKTNVWITLAPYFFPLYTVLLIAIYYTLGIFVEVERYHLAWMTGIGLTYGFHISFTLSTLLHHQSDIQAYGHLLSYSIIFLINVLGICLWIVMISEVSAVDFAKTAGEHGLATFLWIRETALAAKKYSDTIIRNPPAL